MTREEAIAQLEFDMRTFESYITWDMEDKTGSAEYNAGVRVMSEIAYQRAEKLRDELAGDHGRDILR